ncbi:MAG: BamA/TamA family outer membrane protein, partial [Nitrosomonadaceae bacterium]
LNDQDLSPLSPARSRNFVRDFGNPTINVPVSIRWVRDVRNSGIWPTEGNIQRVFAEVGLPMGDLKYFKLNYELQLYYPITDFFTLRLNGKLGYGDGYTGDELPFFKNFFAGGNRTVRGYRVSSLGPRDISFRALGGNYLTVGSVEILFPMPGLENDKSVRLGGFLDAGTVWGPNGLFPDSEGMRYSAGISGTWISPMGPLKVSIAYPINDDINDRTQPFQFQFGQQF